MADVARTRRGRYRLYLSWLLLADLLATAPPVDELPLVKWIRSARLWIAVPFASIVVSGIGSFLYDVVRL